MSFGRYDPHYLLIPREIRHQEQTFVDIWMAVIRHDIERLERLAGDLPLGRVTDASRNTLVHVSAMHGNAKAMGYLLTRRLQDRPDVNAANIFGTTALHVALDRVQSERYTSDHKEVLGLLLGAGADPRVLNGLGNSALVVAASCSCPTAVFKIYERMCELEPDKYDLAKILVHAGWTVRHFFWTKDLNLIKKMFVYDTDALRYANSPESTPLYDAIEARASPELFSLLLEHGVNPNVGTDELLNTPLHRACELSRSWDNLDVIKVLLKAGANPDAVNARRCSCLHTALAYGTTELIRLMLVRDVDVHAKDDTGNTSLHFAAFNGNVEAMKILVDWGLAIDAKNACGVTPLHMSSRRGRPEATEYLLQRGADVNWKDHRGWAALHYAVQSCTCEGPMHECVDTIDILVDHGAELDVEKPGERSALGICVDNKNIPFGNFLIRCLAMVEPRNPHARALSVRLIEKNRMMMEYYDSCTKEIKKMKKMMLYGRISFFKALTCSMKELRALVCNPDYVDAMNKLIHTDYISKSFLIYRYRLISRFVSAMNVQGPINDAIDALCYLTGSADPGDEIITTIVKFLEADELKTLGKCKLIIEKEQGLNQDKQENWR